jgi:hypothetical protein
MAAPDLPMTMKVYSATGTFLCEFPYFVSLMVLDAMNDVGSFSFNWNANSPGASNLISDTALQMAVCMDFRDGNGYTEVARYLYEQDTYDPSMQESAIIQANGRSIVALLDQAIVYPKAGVGSTTTSWSFTGASPGKIMNDLINAAKARGCFPSLTTSFTSGQDSSGNAWTQSFTNAYGAGQSLLQVLLGLAQGGLCDFNMSGTTLNLYNPNTTLATDRSTSIYLRRGRDIISLPAQRDRTQIGTAMLAIGDNGVNVERTASTLGTIGRYEKYLAQGGVTDPATLRYWADQNLGAIDDQQVSYTPSYVSNITNSTPVPWKDYHPGDYISLDLASGQSPVKFRARQWAVQCTPGGPTTIQPTLNDVFYDQNTLLQGRVQALSGSVTGVSTIVNLPGPNATTPNPPAFDLTNTYTGAYYSPATGTTLAQIELAWTTPTNTDGTTVTDGADIIVQYRLSTKPIYPIAWSQLQGKPWSSINGNPWSNPLATPQNQQWTTVKVPFDQNNTIVAGLICGETYEFQIAASDVSGNTSLFSGSSLIATARDNVAPSKPDAPTVAASMVAVQVMHDLGQASGGTYNLEQDLDHLEVHFSYDPSFTPVPGVGSATYLGKLIANAGMMQSGIAAVGTFHVTSVTGIYIKVIAVDESGNTSPPSDGSGVTAVLIDDQHISSLNVSKLLAGTIMATILIGGSFSTATSGRRVTLDNTGLHAYDDSSNLIFDLNSGTPIVTLGSSAAGAKITLDTSPGYPTLNFYDNSATNHASILAFSVGSGSGSNSAGIQIISGVFTITSGTYAGSYQHLLSMQGDNGIDLAVIDSSGTLATNGGGVALTPSAAIIGLFREAATHGGQLRFDYDSATTDSFWELDGYLGNSTSIAQQGLSFQYFTVGTPGSGGASVGYSVTFYSTPYPIPYYSCGNISTPTVGGNVNAISTSGYSITLSATAPANWSTILWLIRSR